MSESRSAKTEQPTAKRVLEARQKGNVPRSKELSSALGLGSFLLFCHLLGPDWLSQVKRMMSYTLSNLAMADLTSQQWISVVNSLGSVTAKLLMMPVGVMAVAGLAGNLVQGAPPFTLKPFKPDLTKINPLKGVKKVFALRSLMTLGKAALNVVLFTVIAWTAVRDAVLDGVPSYPGVEGTLLALFAVLNKIILRIVGLWAIIAIIDLLFTRYDHTRNLKMTKQEVKDERKQHEGDPRVKARIRSKQFEIARARMMAEVHKATVVVTNPTHYAVALRYVPEEMDVPQVLAKGRGLIAQRIREIAKEHRVPIISDAPLARALYRLVPLGGYIPATMFRAVAEVLALVLRPRTRRTTPPQPEATP